MSDPLVFNPNDHDGNADPRLIEELMRDRQTMNDPRVMAALLLEERAQRKARASEGPQYPHKPEVGVGSMGWATSHRFRRVPLTSSAAPWPQRLILSWAERVCRHLPVPRSTLPTA